MTTVSFELMHFARLSEICHKFIKKCFETLTDAMLDVIGYALVLRALPGLIIDSAQDTSV